MALPYYLRVEIDAMLQDIGASTIFWYSDITPRPTEGSTDTLYIKTNLSEISKWNDSSYETKQLGIVEHNEATGKQGGQEGEYYHLTEQERLDVQDIPFINNTLSDHEERIIYLESNVRPPVDEVYDDIDALIADQNNQEEGFFYEVKDASDLSVVDDGGAIMLLNTDTPTGTQEDYIITWIEGKHQNIRPFIMRINVGAGEEFQIPLSSNYFYDFEVKWGDDTNDVLLGRSLPNPSHTYTTAGTYDVEIRGKFPFIGYLGGTVGTTKITEIVQWGDIVWSRFYFNGASNLVSLPTEAPDLYNVTHMNISFKETGITEVPATLLDKAVNVVSFNQMFKDAAVTTLNAGMFKNCGAAQTMEETFLGCPITTVPLIFQGCFSLKNVTGIFRNSSVSSIPENLFDDNLILSNADSAFMDANLTVLPYDIFRRNNTVQTFHSCFRNNNLTGIVPELWLRNSDAIGTICFEDAQSADNYAQVPESWGGNAGVSMPPQKPLNDRAYWNEVDEKLQLYINGTWRDVEGGESEPTDPPPSGSVTDVISYALSSPSADLSSGDTDSFLAPYNFTLNSYFAGVSEAPSGSSLVVGLKKNGSSVTSSDAIIDSGDNSSLTGTAPTITTQSFVKGDIITPVISQVGSLDTGKSLKIYLEITKT